MALFTEVDRTYNRDASGHRAGTRTWKTTLASATAALDQFETVQNGRVHPDDPILLFDRVDASPLGIGSGFLVTAYYTTFRGGRFTQRPPRQPGQQTSFRAWGQRDVQIEIPIAVREPRIVGEGGQPVTFLVWVPQVLKVQETNIQRIYRTRLDMSAYDQLDAIAQQKLRIHTIRGVRYQFMGGEVREGDGTYIDVTYTWELDAGTPDKIAFQPGEEASVVVLPIRREQGEEPGMLRKPYSRLKNIPPADPRDDFGYSVRLYQWAEDPDGWKKLPGTSGL